MNKFGDPQVDYFKIFGGTSPNPVHLIDTSRTTLKYLEGLEKGLSYFFRLRAVGKDGVESDYSNEEEIYIRDTEPGSNLIINEGFEQGLDYWSFQLDSAVSASVQTGAGLCHFNIQDGGGLYRDVQIRQDFIPLYQGRNYLFEFDARADKSRIIEVILGEGKSPWRDYSQLDYIAVSTDWEHHSYAFKMLESTDLDASLMINAGGEAGDLYIDKLSLKMETSVGTEDSQTPAGFKLYQGYPNPFDKSTRIDWLLPEKCTVKLCVFNAWGQKVKEFSYPDQVPGKYSREIQLNNHISGVYYYTLEAKSLFSAGIYRDTKRLVLLK